MKIRYIANVRLPTEKAHGIQIVKMCEAFANSGHQVELIIPWRFNKIKDNVFEYYGVKENFKIKRIFSFDLIPLNIPKIGFWIQSASFVDFLFLYLLFKKEDIVYSRDAFVVFWLQLIRKNIVYEMHIPGKHRFLYKNFKKIIVITKKIKEYLIDQGIKENRIIVAPDGVDLNKFNIKTESRKDNKKIVLYTGHLYQWKGAEILARAAKYLDKNVLVRFVGGTDKDIKRFKERYGDKENIEIIGHVNYKDIPILMKNSDVLVLPNSGKKMTSRYWTSPMKMFEYMACQKPIVASDLLSIREVLNEKNAILVEPDNPEALADGIKKALVDDSVSKESFKDVQKYTWDKRAEKILSFIK